MIIRGIEEQDLQAALEVANYAYHGNLRFREEPEPITPRRLSWRVRLGVKDFGRPGHRSRPWRDRYWGAWEARRYARLACYHAHRDFLYAVFERAPYAKIFTAVGAYRGLADFEDTNRRIGQMNVGSHFELVRFADCCDCPKKFPRIEEMVPEPYLGEYAIEPGREIYSGLEGKRR